MNPTRLFALLMAPVFMTLAVTTTQAQSSPEVTGFLLYKPIPAMADRDATLVQFASVDEHAQVVNYKAPGSNRSIRLFREKVPVVVEYQDFTGASFITPEEFGELQKQRETLVEVAEKYPQTKDVVTAPIAKLDDALKKFGEGKIMIKGVWTTEEEAKRSVNDNRSYIASMTIREKDGTQKTYYDVRVLTIEFDRVRVTHAEGSLSVPHSQLPPELQELWKFKR